MATVPRRLKLRLPALFSARRSIKNARRQGLLLQGALCAVLISASALAWLAAAAGDLDPTFGTGGIVTTDVAGCCESASDVAVQPDGMIVVAGTVLSSFDTFVDNNFMLVRYDSTGALDGSFGNAGVVITGFTPTSSDSAFQLALQPDGRIVVAGWSRVAGVGNPTLFAVARFLPDGDLDSTFDGDGKLTFGFGTPSAKASSLAIQADGRIVVAGVVSDDNGINDFAVARLNGDGSLDPNFGTLGKVRTPISTAPPSTFLDDDYANAVAIQPDGGIVVGGTTNRADNRYEMAIVRYLANGTLDPGFAASGKLTFTFYSYSDQINALAIQPDGKIIAAGETRNPNGALVSEFAVVRLNTNGTFDTTFDGDGKATARFQPTHPQGVHDAQGRDVVIQPDGRIVLVGNQGNDFAIARYQAGGALDPSFSEDGQLVTSLDVGGSESANAVALQSDGKLLTAGGTLPQVGGGQFAKILVARFDAGGGSLGQTINFAPLSNKTFGDPPFVVLATASSGLPVRFTATGACSVAGDAVTLTTIGTCAVTASQDGDAVYASAPDVTQAFEVVGARTLTVVRAGTGAGRVSSAPLGVDCGLDCVGTFQDGQVVALTAQPDSGSFFAGWSGDGDCSDGQVTMNVDVSCVATFTSQRFIAELVAEIRAGTTGSAPTDMAVFNGSLYFAANDGANGRELWRLDTNAAAPVMAADIVQGPGSSSPSQLTVAGGVLYFRATTSTGFELWKYDGVSAALAADINTGAGGSFLTSLTAFGNEVVFRATDGTDGEELFAYSPAAGLKPLNVNRECAECGSNPYGLMVYEGRLYFGAAESSLIGEELLSYDGTAVTRLTNGLAPSGPIGVNGRLVYSAGLQITQLRSYEIATGFDTEIVLPAVNISGPVAGGFTRMNDVVYFAAQNDLNGRELWVTDGTQAGTRLVADVFAGPTGSDPRNLIPFNGELVFSAIDAAAGRELRATSGSGSRLIVDLAPGPASSAFDGLIVVSDLLFFGAGDGPTEQPWVTDGTSTGTEVIRRAGGQLINPAGGSIDGARFTPFNGAIYFAARSSDFNTELWKISVGGSNQPPVAVATAPATAQVGGGCVANVILNGTGSSDPELETLTYSWTENGLQVGTGASPTVQLGVGTHTLRLTVTDPQGASSFDEVTVIVTSSTTLTYLGPSILQASGSNLIRVGVAQGGNPAGGAALVVTVNGTAFQATSDGTGEASVDVGAVAGPTATITIDYAGAACGAATLTVTKTVNRWPTVSPSAPSSVFVDATCTASVALMANASDLDGDPLTYLWSEAGVTLSTQAVPTVSLAPGLHTIDLTVADGKGGSATGSVAIDVKKALMGLSFITPLPQFTAGVPATVSARLTDGANQPIQGATLAFAFSGTPVSGTTDATGVATVTLTPATNGFQEISVSYDGDSCRQAVSFKTNVTVAQPPATVFVTTVVTNDHGGNLGPADFTNTVIASSPNPSTFAGSASGVSVTVNVGGYLIAQTPRAEYTTSMSAECSGTIAAGEKKTCTITNNDRPTTLTLIKQVVNDNGGTLQASAWTLRANSTPFTQGQATPVAPGQYTLDEIGPGGYTATAWNCVGGSLTGSTLTIAPNTEVSCTIANDDQPATLTLTKFVQNDNGGTRAAADWQLRAGGQLFVSGISQPINAGTYALAESGPGGYAASAWSCTGSGSLAGSTLTLGPGQAASCSITNDDIGKTGTTITQIGPGTGSVGPMVLTATLLDAAGGRVAGRTLIFALVGQTTAAPTDASGVATATLNLAAAPGTVPLIVTFPGDDVYTSTQASRLFQIVVDTDDDGIPDSWEINGADTDGDGAIDLNLPAMGANPLRKDVFVEVDWMVKPSACVWLVCWTNGGVLQPQRAVLDDLVGRFATAPVSNPNGSTGITLHVDGGPNTVMNPATGEPWGPLSRAGVVPYDEALGAVDGVGEYDWSEFDALKQVFLEPARRPVFHYAIYADTLALSSVSGISRGIPAADFILAAGHPSWNGGLTATQERGLFLHEFGHNLGLRHGGADDINYKPNYFSVLNYLFALTGLPPDNRTDFSTTLEQSIDETLVGDRNGDGRLTTLVGFLDWPNVVFTGGGIGDLFALLPPTKTPLEAIDPVELQERGAYARDGDGLLHFRGPSVLVLDSGMQSFTVDVKNISEVDAAYTIAAESAIVGGTVSADTSISAGGVAQVTLPVNTTGLVPGEYLVSFTLRRGNGEFLHRQSAIVVVVDLAVPENQEAARAALEDLAALPPGSGLDPSVVNQITEMFEGSLSSWTADVRVAGRVAFEAVYQIEEPVIPRSPGGFTVQSLPGTSLFVVKLVRAGKAASGTVRLQRPTGEIFEAPIAGKWDESTRTFDGTWLAGKAKGGSISFRLREP